MRKVLLWGGVIAFFGVVGVGVIASCGAATRFLAEEPREKEVVQKPAPKKSLPKPIGVIATEPRVSAKPPPPTATPAPTEKMSKLPPTEDDLRKPTQQEDMPSEDLLPEDIEDFEFEEEFERVPTGEISPPSEDGTEPLTTPPAPRSEESGTDETQTRSPSQASGRTSGTTKPKANVPAPPPPAPDATGAEDEVLEEVP